MGPVEVVPKPADLLEQGNFAAQRAIEDFERALRLSPLDPEIFRMHAGVAIVHLLAGRFDDASSTAEKAFRDFPGFLIVVGTMAASHALAGRTLTPPFAE